MLAKARNEYLTILRAEPQWDYLIAVDTDMCHKWNMTAHKEVLKALINSPPETWTAAFANGICGWYKNDLLTQHSEMFDPQAAAGSIHPRYCDLFAYRDHANLRHFHYDLYFSPNSGAECQNFYKQAYSPPGCHQLMSSAVTAFPVRGAFGGLGIYNAKFLRQNLDCVYLSDDAADNGYGCEHVPLNNCINKHGGKMLTIPQWSVNWEGCSGPIPVI